MFKPVLYYYNNKPIKNFTIIGERHSGTNWLEKILSNQLHSELTWEFGSKHFVNPNPNLLAGANNCLFVCITRNIYDWIGGFYKLPHHVESSMLKDMQTFLLNEWKSSVYDNDYLTKKPYKNLFELRNYKLKYISVFLPFIVNNMICLKYEDLLIQPTNIVDFISNKYQIKKTNKKYGKFIQPRRKKLYKLKQNVIKTINDNTNWQTENFFGYYAKDK